MSVLYFLVLVGVLVAIHEFGHFVAAKLLDFKVTRFSIGFGQPLVRLRGGETEYQIALVPLGGYVRILGEDPGDAIPPEDRGRAFSQKPLWQRLVVVFAGPAASFLLPVIIYFVAFAGERELPAAVVGDVVAGSPAARAGFEPGDRVLSIAGEEVRYWEDVEAMVEQRVGHQLRFRLRRGGRVVERDVAPVVVTGSGPGGERTRKGWIGITQAPFPPQVGILDPASPAGRAGLQTGDIIASVDGRAVGSWTERRRELGRAARRQPGRRAAPPPAGGRRRLEHGLHPADRFVRRVEPGSPAARAGIRPGDLLTTIDGEPIAHWLVLERRLRAHPDKTFQIG